MSSNIHVHRPYVLKALSKPLGHADGPGAHTVGDVFGQKQNSKRRRRPELSVAIDGEAVHIYDILSSQALTSYLVPPESSFSCPAYSLRWRPSTGNATRYTYISTIGARPSKKGNEIKLFKDEIAESGTTTTSTSSHYHRCDKPIIYLTATSSGCAAKSVKDLGTSGHDLIAVAADGTLLCLNGETLESKWQSAPATFTQELSSRSTIEGFQVEFVQSAQAADIVDGLFEGKNELFGVFQEKVHREGFNPDILVAVTSLQRSPEVRQRHIHILALSQERDSRQANGQKVVSILVAPLPNEFPVTKYQLDVKSGALQVQSNDAVFTYGLKHGVPRLEGKLQVPGLTSFVRLSKTSVLAATATALSIYNPVYRSLQTTTPLQPENSQSSAAIHLAVYFGGREMVVGLQGSSLIAIQIEAPANRSTKRRAEGLLVDAIRRGIPRERPCTKHTQTAPAQATILAEVQPGVTSEAEWAEWQEKSMKADKLLASNNLQAFEEFMAGIFQVQVKEGQTKEEEPKTNGETVNAGSDADEPAAAANWTWLSAAEKYARVDRRWIIYAINKVFAWDNTSRDTNGLRIQCRLPDSNILGYLVGAGHLTVSNIKSAFREHVTDVDEIDNILGEEFPALLAEVDPALELLLAYLAATQLGATELTCALKLLLRSLDLLEDPSKVQKLTDLPEQEADGDNDVIKMELDRAEEELQVTEYYLGSDSSSRAQGLSVAFSKLAMCPASTTTQSLRRLFKPDEIICLMNVLRMELIKDGWTTRYLDGSADDEEEAEAAPDGSIRVIAELMSRCLDSVGLGGWMAFDAMLANGGDQHQDSVDFFSQFQAEVSVALEGVVEAVRLQGTLAEAVGYLTRARTALEQSKLTKDSWVITRPLPFGLKTESKPSLTRVRGGGEIVQRSMRQIGHFHSKQRKAYSVTVITEDHLLGHTTKRAYKEEGTVDL